MFILNVKCDICILSFFFSVFLYNYRHWWWCCTFAYMIVVYIFGVFNLNLYYLLLQTSTVKKSLPHFQQWIIHRWVYHIYQVHILTVHKFKINIVYKNLLDVFLNWTQKNIYHNYFDLGCFIKIDEYILFQKYLFLSPFKHD